MKIGKKMKAKLTLQQQLDHRKYKEPNSFCYWFYKMVMVDFQIKRFNPKINTVDDIKIEEFTKWLMEKNFPFRRPYNVLAR